MTRSTLALSAITLLGILLHAIAYAEQLKGPIDQTSGPKWQAAYMDLDPPRDFKNGERLQIRLQGSAQVVRVRLLPAGASADRPTGAIEGKIRVPPGGSVEITLQKDHPKVKQISVHAGKEAFGESLGAQNGDAEIVRVDVLPRR